MSEGNLKTYVIGFVSSILLTLIAFILVISEILTGFGAVLAIMGLASLQLIVQLVCFLHLGRESKPHWNLTVFAFMVVVLVIVVFGSLWIMYSLNYHVPSPSEIEQQIFEEESIYR